MGEHQPWDEIGTVARRNHCDIRNEPIQDVRQAHRRHDQFQGFPIHPGLAAQYQLAVSGLDQCSERRRGKERAFRDSGRYYVLQIGKRHTNRIRGLMINSVCDHCHRLRVVGSQFRDRAGGGGSDLFRAALSTMHHQYDRRSKIGGDLGIEGQLRAGRDVGIVRAHDHDHVEAIGELTKALDDDVQGLIGIFARSLIGHPDGLVIGLGDARLVDKKINNEVDVVTAGACSGQWPEHPD